MLSAITCWCYLVGIQTVTVAAIKILFGNWKKWNCQFQALFWVHFCCKAVLFSKWRVYRQHLLKVFMMKKPFVKLNTINLVEPIYWSLHYRWVELLFLHFTSKQQLFTFLFALTMRPQIFLQTWIELWNHWICHPKYILLIRSEHV